jgi:predicted ATP-grasp superfamily ATP-dependent carboligase
VSRSPSPPGGPQLRPRALVGFAEAVAGPETAFSLLDAGFEVVAFTRSGASPSLRKCPEVRLVEVTAPKDDTAAAVRELELHVDALDPAVVLPLDDGAVWLCDRAGEAVGSRVAGPIGDPARLALDKRLQLEAAARAGFDVVPTRALGSARELLEGANEFPLVVKPALAVEERSGRIMLGPVSVCVDESDLERAVAAYRPDQEVIAQPFVAGEVEGVFGLAHDGELVVSSAQRRIRGISAKGSTSACVPIDSDPGLVDATRRLLARAGWSGLFMVELVRDAGGRAWFMELNGRAWGSMALARRMGLEYPAWAARQKLDPSFAPVSPSPRDPVTCRHLGREVLHLLSVLSGADRAALGTGPRRGRAVLEVLRIGRDDRWYNLRAGCRRLFVYDAVQTVRSGLSSKLRSG